MSVAITVAARRGIVNGIDQTHNSPTILCTVYSLLFLNRQRSYRFICRVTPIASFCFHIDHMPDFRIFSRKLDHTFLVKDRDTLYSGLPLPE